MKKLFLLLLLSSSVFASDKNCAADIPDAMGYLLDVDGKTVNMAAYYCKFGSKFTVGKHSVNAERLYSININGPKTLTLYHVRTKQGVMKLCFVNSLIAARLTDQEIKSFYENFEQTYKVNK